MILELDRRDRRVSTAQTPRSFLDFIVDGKSLHESHGCDLITWFGWLAPEVEAAAARRLLAQESPDVDGRVSLYVCPEDADLFCGVLTMILDTDGGEFVWRDLARSTFDFMDQSWYHNTDPFSRWPELRFDAAIYEALMRNLIRDEPSPSK